MIAVHQVSRRFGDRAVLSGLTFEVRDGEIYGLIGGNGAGKSTALSLIAGLLRPDAGTVRIDSPSGAFSSRRLGVAPQDPALYGRLTTRENLWFFAALYGGSLASVRRRVDSVAELWRLGPHLATRVERLSGGWRRRVSLAVAMAHGPDLLLLDEPTAGLDAETRYALWDVLRGLGSRGVTILLTTHLFDEAETLCDRIGILDAGRLQTEGTRAELLRCVDAAAVAEVEAPDPRPVEARVRGHGWRARFRADRLMILLPDRLSLAEVAASLDGLNVASLRLREAGLEDAYFETVSRA